jgi:hypothetical protein
MKSPMAADTRKRFAGTVMFAVGAMVASPATAQQWVVFAGAGGRVEFNDNYFFTAPGNTTAAGDPQSAFTLSLTPFVAAARRTEVSDVTAVLAIGANKVWGPSPPEEYLSATFSLDGTLRQERSTWRGSASYTRSSSLEEVIRDADLVLARTYTDSASMGGTYSYALTDRLSIGAAASGYGNWYDPVEGLDETSDDLGFNVSGNLGYVLSDQTQLAYSLGYTYYASDFTRSGVVTTTLGVVHTFSPQLTVSGTAGGYWTDTTARQDLPGQGVPIAAGETRNDNGTLFGGSVNYAFSANTRFDFSVSQSIEPSGAGVIGKNETASVALTHQFSNRLTGRLGASYVRSVLPAGIDGFRRDETVTGQAGVTYRIDERWKLDAGYEYTRTRYEQDSSEPSSNLVFLSISYNWPGASTTGWIGRPADTQGLPGARPLSISGRPSDLTGIPAPSTTSDSLPFDTFTLP